MIVEVILIHNSNAKGKKKKKVAPNSMHGEV